MSDVEHGFSPERRALLAGGLAAGAAALAGTPARADEAPAPGDELAAMTVADFGRALRARRLSARELVDAHLKRITRYDGAAGLNAYLTVDGEGALREADRLDTLARQGQFLGPLHGIPVTVKDNLDTRGLPTTGGSRILAGWRPAADASVVARLRAAGAIVLGKANLHELAFGVTTNNPHFGPAKNPYDRTRIPGGSSGGCAIAVAAGLAAAAVGTDTGGSIRIPAALCDIVGLKPTLGRVGRGGMLSLSFTRDVIGPMTRSVEDAALLLAAMAGPDDRDADAARQAVPDYAAALVRGLHGVRVGVPRRLFWEDNDPAVEQASSQALGTLTAMGATVVDVDVPDLALAGDTGFAIVLAEAVYLIESYLRQVDPTATLAAKLSQLGPDVREILGGQVGPDARPLPGYAYLDAVRTKRARIVRGFEAALAGVDALVTPTTPLAATRIGEDVEVELRGRKVNTFRTFIRDCDPISVAGLPAVSVPAGFVSPGLPVGVQFVGRAWDEERLLRIAYAYEQATRLRRPPRL